jgi:hypothetical protein
VDVGDLTYLDLLLYVPFGQIQISRLASNHEDFVPVWERRKRRCTTLWAHDILES